MRASNVPVPGPDFTDTHSHSYAWTYQSTERTQQVNRQLNQRQAAASSTPTGAPDHSEDIALEAEETEEDFAGNPLTLSHQQSSHVADLGTAARNEDEESLIDEDILESEANYVDDDDFEDDEEQTDDDQEISQEHAEFIRFHQEFYEKNGYPHPDMALDGEEVVPINGRDSAPTSPNQQQQPGIVASQLAPGQQGDIVSLTASDGQVLTFSPGHQHYDQALQLHHNTQAAIQQQQQLQQQQAEPPISVEDGESNWLFFTFLHKNSSERARLESEIHILTEVGGTLLAVLFILFRRTIRAEIHA
jgi:hypothetical protein